MNFLHPWTDDEQKFIDRQYGEYSPLEKLLLEFPDKAWKLYRIERNPNVSLKFKLDHPEFGWKWRADNPKLTLGDIDDHKEIKWDLVSYAGNPYAVFDDLTSHEIPSEQMESFCMTSCHIEEAIKDHPEIDWNWDDIMCNVYISTEFVEANINKLNELKDTSVMTNPAITLDVVLRHPEIAWDFKFLSMNSSIKLESMLRHPELPWQFQFVSYNPSLTSNDVVEHPEIKWDYEGLSKVLDLEYIKQHPELPWDYERVSLNNHLTYEYVKDNIDKPWNWPNISYNKFLYDKFARQKKINSRMKDLLSKD